MLGVKDSQSTSSSAEQLVSSTISKDEASPDHHDSHYQLYRIHTSSDNSSDDGNNSNVESGSSSNDTSSDEDDGTQRELRSVDDQQQLHPHYPGHTEQEDRLSCSGDSNTEVEEYDIEEPCNSPVIAVRSYHKQRQFQDPPEERIYEMFETLSTSQNRRFRRNHARIVIDRQRDKVDNIDYASVLAQARAEIGSSLRIGNPIHVYDSTEPSSLGPNRAESSPGQKIIRKLIDRQHPQKSEEKQAKRRELNEAKAREKEVVEMLQDAVRELHRTRKHCALTFQEADYAKHKLGEARKKSKMLKVQVGLLLAEIESLTNDKTARESKFQSGEFDSEKVVELELQVKELEQQQYDNHCALGQKQSTVDALVKELDACASSVQDLEIEIEKQKTDMLQLAKEKVAAEKKYDRLLLWNTNYLQMEDHLKTLFMENPGLPKQVMECKFEEFDREWKDRFAAMEAKYHDSLPKEITGDTTPQMEQYEAIVRILHERSRELRHVRCQKLAIQQNYDVQKVETDKVKEDLSDMNTELQACRREVERVESLNASLIIQLNHAHYERDEQIVELDSTKAKLEEAIAKIGLRCDEVNLPKSYITELQLDIESLHVDIEIFQEEKKMMQLDIDHSVSRIGELEEDVRSAREEKSTLNFQLVDLKLEHEHFLLRDQEASKVLHNEITRLKQWINDLLKENQGLSKQRNCSNAVNQGLSPIQIPLICRPSNQNQKKLEASIFVSGHPGLSPTDNDRDVETNAPNRHKSSVTMRGDQAKLIVSQLCREMKRVKTKGNATRNRPPN
jgi:hypothetical protein